MQEGKPGELCPLPIATAAPQDLYAFDHVYPASVATSNLTVVLYGVLGTPALASWHSALLSALSTHPWGFRYVFRHVAPSDAALPTRLEGFGVALDLKNMEYKALDDRAPVVSSHS